MSWGAITNLNSHLLLWNFPKFISVFEIKSVGHLKFSEGGITLMVQCSLVTEVHSNTVNSGSL